MAERKKKIYISGPISAPTPEGVQKNLDYLAKIASIVSKQNPDATVYNPGGNKQEGWGYREYMVHDLEKINNSESVNVAAIEETSDEGITIPSEGVLREIKYAELKRKKVTFENPEDKEKLKRRRGRGQ